MQERRALGRWSFVLVLAVVASAGAQERRHERSETDGTLVGESTFLDTPPFPALDITDAFRIQLSTFSAPDAPLGSGHVSLSRPELRGRADMPLGERSLLRASARLATSRYRFRGAARGSLAPLEVGQEDLDLYRAQLALEAGHRFEPFRRSLVTDDEVWSLLGTLFGGSRWEDGEFRTGLEGGIAAGVGYEIPDRLHVALGVALRTLRAESGVDLGPLVSVRWDVTERLTLRSRELGLQIDYELTPVLDVYVSGFRTSERFQLSDRAGAPGDLTFRDRMVLAGAGFDLMFANWLHLELELGGIAHRRIRIREEDLGTLASSRGDPSVYFDVRIEVRL